MPVVSAKSGLLYEKRLALKLVSEAAQEPGQQVGESLTLEERTPTPREGPHGESSTYLLSNRLYPLLWRCGQATQHPLTTAHACLSSRWAWAQRYVACQSSREESGSSSDLSSMRRRSTSPSCRSTSWQAHRHPSAPRSAGTGVGDAPGAVADGPASRALLYFVNTVSYALVLFAKESHLSQSNNNHREVPASRVAWRGAPSPAAAERVAWPRCKPSRRTYRRYPPACLPRAFGLRGHPVWN